MAIIINTPVIHKSYASVLSRIDPNALIFDNPNQQGTKLPAWFIIHREPVSSTCAIDGYQWLVYAIDIYYMVEYNKPRLFDEYASIADQLDLELEYLPIYGTDTVVHVFDRSWELAMNALKYSTTLRLRVHPSVQREPYMQVIESLEVFLKMQNEAILSFQNTSHPEFDAQLPNPISVTKGRSVNLPFVSGEFEDDNYKWTPSGWTLGNFGALIQLNESMTADLLWRSEEKTASLSFTNTLHPEFDVDLPDTIIANKGTAVVLPTVEGSFPEGIKIWQPSAWDIGAFGDEYTLNSDTVAHLLFDELETVPTAYFTEQGSSASSDFTPISGNNILYNRSGSLIEAQSNEKYGLIAKYNKSGTKVDVHSGEYLSTLDSSLIFKTSTTNQSLFKILYDVGKFAYLSWRGAISNEDSSVTGWSAVTLYDTNGTYVFETYGASYAIVAVYKANGTKVENTGNSRLSVDTRGRLMLSGDTSTPYEGYILFYKRL